MCCECVQELCQSLLKHVLTFPIARQLAAGPESCLFLFVSMGTLETYLVFTRCTLFMCAEPQCKKNAIASWQREVKEFMSQIPFLAVVTWVRVTVKSRGHFLGVAFPCHSVLMYSLKVLSFSLSKMLDIFERAGSALSAFWNKHVGEGCIETKDSNLCDSLAYSAAENQNTKQTYNFWPKKQKKVSLNSLEFALVNANMLTLFMLWRHHLGINQVCTCPSQHLEIFDQTSRLWRKLFIFFCVELCYKTFSKSSSLVFTIKHSFHPSIA